LIEKNLEHGYCLFTNLSGILIAKPDFDELDHLLSAGGLQRMDAIPAFDNALAYTGAELRRQIPGLEQQVREAEAAWQEAQRREKQQLAAERLHRLEAERRHKEEQRRLQEEAQRREEQRREEERRQARAQTLAREQEEARRQVLEQILETVARMQPGGWLELLQEDNRRVSCKLGLRLKSSGKMVFVDSLGRKVAEFRQRELAEKIVDGSAAILDYGVAFDSTLGDLINERSEKIFGNEPE
jgi:hypothetical protein